MNLEKKEREMVVQAIEKAKGNRSRAAEYLGLSRRAFYRRLEKFGLATEDEMSESA